MRSGQKHYYQSIDGPSSLGSLKPTYVNKVLDGALAGRSMLGSESQEGHHSQAAVLNLVLLVRRVLGALGHSEGVEVAAACVSVFAVSACCKNIEQAGRHRYFSR